MLHILKDGIEEIVPIHLKTWMKWKDIFKYIYQESQAEMANWIAPYLNQKFRNLPIKKFQAQKIFQVLWNIQKTVIPLLCKILRNSEKKREHSPTCFQQLAYPSHESFMIVVLKV